MGPARLCPLRRMKLDIINEQLHDRLFSTVCVYIYYTRHADKRSLALGPPMVDPTLKSVTVSSVQKEVRLQLF